ncbi:MAG: hypothetical protein IT267_02705 [Saprospiraceae bacterium]|nr:hypothetical protein [Saprospiraceae bacterium]
MTKEQELYIEIGKKFESSEQSQMFGKPCFKIRGKAFISFFQNAMVFKLSGTVHTEALHLNGSQLFDPSGKNRPMKEWIQIPFQHKDSWYKFAKEALTYVSAK